MNRIPTDSGALLAALAGAQARLVADLCLSAGMFVAVASVACLALNWRRTALIGGLLYCLTLCAARTGRSSTLGPVGLVVAATGLLARRRR